MSRRSRLDSRSYGAGAAKKIAAGQPLLRGSSADVDLVDVELAGQPAPDVRPREPDAQEPGEADQRDPRDHLRGAELEPAEADQEPDQRPEEGGAEEDPELAERAVGGSADEYPADQHQHAAEGLGGSGTPLLERLDDPVHERELGRVVGQEHEDGDAERAPEELAP